VVGGAQHPHVCMHVHDTLSPYLISTATVLRAISLLLTCHCVIRSSCSGLQ